MGSSLGVIDPDQLSISPSVSPSSGRVERQYPAALAPIVVPGRLASFSSDNPPSHAPFREIDRRDVALHHPGPWRISSGNLPLLLRKLRAVIRSREFSVGSP